VSALMPSIDSKVDVTACPCCCCPVPLLLVFRRLDIHLVEKADDDDDDESMSSLVMDGSSNKVCRSDDILESIIGGASLGGDG
jgi:hypothetical protein